MAKNARSHKLHNRDLGIRPAGIRDECFKSRSAGGYPDRGAVRMAPYAR